MNGINTLVVRPDQAISAYQQTSGSAAGGGTGSAAGDSFGSMLERTIGGAVATGQDADASATNAVVNGGDITHVVTAVSQAQLALQEVVAVRDKVVQAYQDVMKMSI